MSKTPPSIFNDVLGPVMRGPSSSHSAASNRMGLMCRDLVQGDLAHVEVKYDPNGALVTTHTEQGTDMGLYGGFLNWEAADERLPDYKQGLVDAGLEIDVKYEPYGADHPNFYKMKLTGKNGMVRTMDAISTGGGMLQILAIDGTAVEMQGDFYETLWHVSDKPSADVLERVASLPIEKVAWRDGPRPFVQISSRAPLTNEMLGQCADLLGDVAYDAIRAVLPILGSETIEVPFLKVVELEALHAKQPKELWQHAAHYESVRGGISEAEVLEKMDALCDVFEHAVQNGLAGTSYDDRLLPSQSPNFAQKMADKSLVEAGAMNLVILYVSALMESKSSMGVIAAAPTAGSCGAMPGAVLGVADTLGLSKEEKVKALLVAGLIGVFIADQATFSAEVGGCMAECGSGAGMAAAAIVGMSSGTFEQQLAAASMALQNSFGMTCDPIANRVEAPCLGKNTMAATNALACANMAIAGYLHLVPLDEVLQAMDAVGQAIPHELCCTAKGGLSVTATSDKLTKQLHGITVQGKKISC